jgi:hypothetical protein
MTLHCLRIARFDDYPPTSTPCQENSPELNPRQRAGSASNRDFSILFNPLGKQSTLGGKFQIGRDIPTGWHRQANGVSLGVVLARGVCTAHLFTLTTMSCPRRIVTPAQAGAGIQFLIFYFYLFTFLFVSFMVLLLFAFLILNRSSLRPLLLYDQFPKNKSNL